MKVEKKASELGRLLAAKIDPRTKVNRVPRTSKIDRRERDKETRPLGHPARQGSTNIGRLQWEGDGVPKTYLGWLKGGSQVW